MKCRRGDSLDGNGRAGCQVVSLPGSVRLYTTRGDGICLFDNGEMDPGKSGTGSVSRAVVAPLLQVRWRQWIAARLVVPAGAESQTGSPPSCRLFLAKAGLGSPVLLPVPYSTTALPRPTKGTTAGSPAIISFGTMLQELRLA